MKNSNYWIEKLQLESHPEGGYFRETYRSKETLKHSNYPTPRVFSTAIYYLLEGHQISRLHRLKTDEMMHFYEGSPFSVYQLDASGNGKVHLLGRDLEKGESLQVRISAGTWFGAFLENRDGFSLIGCTVAPGFEFEDFEVAERSDLLTKYPQHQKMIEKLTC